MGTCVPFSRSLPWNSWWQTMAGWQVLSRPSAAEGGGRRPAFTGLATQPYSATEVDGWQHKAQPGVSKPGCSTERWAAESAAFKAMGTQDDIVRIAASMNVTVFGLSHLGPEPINWTFGRNVLTNQ